MLGMLLRAIAWLPLIGMVAAVALSGWAVADLPGGALALLILFGLLKRGDIWGAHGWIGVHTYDAPRRKRLSPGFADRLDDLGKRANFAEAPQIVWLEGAPNAWSDGSRRAPRILIAESLHDLLSERQLLAVIGHELAHCMSGDRDLMRLGDRLGRISAAVAVLALLYGAMIFIFQGRSVAADWTWWTLAVAPTTLGWLHLAAMRSREFAADREAGRLTGDPMALTQALARIQFAMSGPDLRQSIEEFTGIRGRGWWRTHPPIEQRIERLQRTS